MLDDAVMRSPVGRGLLGPAVRLRHARNRDSASDHLAVYVDVSLLTTTMYTVDFRSLGDTSRSEHLRCTDQIQLSPWYTI